MQIARASLPSPGNETPGAELDREDILSIHLNFVCSQQCSSRLPIHLKRIVFCFASK